MAVVGARTVHCIANISYYIAHPILVFAVWQGGLSSYGGIAGGLIVALYALHKYNPEISFRTAADVTAPVLLAAWAMGRLLGPQLMFAGGGHPTTAWYGMKYAGEVGYRIPVPIFQSIETLITFSIVLGLSRLYPRWGMPTLSLAVTAYGIWSIGRFFDEYLWLAVPRVWDAVEVFALISLAGSIILMLVLVARRGKDATVLAPPLALEVADSRG